MLAAFLVLLAPGSPLAGGAAPRPAMPPGRLAFRSYGAEAGLTNLAVWGLEQDANGFIWAATGSGLFRYDGARFQRFGKEDGLPSSWVRTVYGAPSGKLWVGTLKGLGCLENGHCRTVGPDQGLPETEVFALVQDGEGRLWVATEAGLFRQSAGGRSFEPAPGWPAGAMARSLWVDPGKLLVAGGDRLFTYDLRTGGAPKELPGPWRARIDGLARDGQGRFWVRTRQGLWMQREPGAPFEDLSSRLPAMAFYDGLLFLGPKGSLLIPTANGLVRVQGDRWENLDEARGLPVPWVSRALVDREGSLWIGGMGIFRSLGGEVWRQYGHKDGIPGGVVHSILRDRAGQFWIGTVDGLHRSTPDGWSLVPSTDKNAILALVQDRAGALWMGGAPARLRRWEPGAGRWTEFPEVTSTITSLHADEAGAIWAGTRRAGLWRVAPRDGRLRCERVNLPGGSPDERIQTLAPGSNGRLWVSGSQGLAVLEKGAWKRLTTADGLASLHTMGVRERNRGDLWLSYLESPGLFQYGYEGGKLVLKQRLGTPQGLSSEQVYFLADDAKGRLWAGTGLGVSLIDGSTIHTFGTGEGLPGDDCNGNAFFAETNGDVWVGTLGGLALFRSSAYTGFPAPPKAYILSAQFGQGAAAPPAATPPEIPARDASVTFQFTGLSYLNESKVHHQVRLVGWDGNTWRPAEFRQARFTNLAPGAYCLEVRAAYATGPWGDTASFSFVILPPWWGTWWFRSLAVLALGGLVVLGVHWRLGNLRRRNRELEDMVKTRTTALAQANQTLQQLTVTDPLTGLKNRRFLDLTIEDNLAKVRRDYHFRQRESQPPLPGNQDMLFFMVDLDHFKVVNDTFGHGAGDQVLRQVRDRLLQAIRETDTMVRWGGEEFLVVACTYDRRQAAALAQRILDLMRKAPFDLGEGRTRQQTCSVGFAPYPLVPGLPPEAVSWERVVEVADRCLYAAKASGRDAWVGVVEAPDAERVASFLAQPGAEVGKGGWQLAASLDDPGQVRWHPNQG